MDLADRSPLSRRRAHPAGVVRHESRATARDGRLRTTVLIRAQPSGEPGSAEPGSSEPGSSEPGFGKSESGEPGSGSPYGVTPGTSSSA